MNILNICMNAPFTENYSYQDNLLTEYQKKLGHRVTIITSTKTRDADGKICYTTPCDKFLENGVRLIRIDRGGRVHTALGWYPELKKYIQICQPQMIFIHGLCSFIPIQAIAYKCKNKEKCIIVADNHQDTKNTPIRSFPFKYMLYLYRLFWKRWIKYVEKIYGTTNWRKLFAEIHLGIPKGKMDVLPTGVDVDRLPQNKELKREEIRNKLQIKDDQFVFITGGKLDYRKKIIETIRAFGQINRFDAVLLVFGPVSSEIKQEFEELLSKDSRITYLGNLESQEIKNFFISSDMGVFPGGHSVLWEEAKGCGLPCIFSQYESDGCTNTCQGYVELENVTEKSIYEQMQTFSTSIEKFQLLKKKAEFCANRFSYYYIAQKSIECYFENALE